MKDLRVTGRILQVSEATRRRNPHLYGPGIKEPQLIVPELPKMHSEPSQGKRVRQDSKGGLNKLETEAKRYIEALHPGVLIRGQSKTFLLANGCRYTPDLCGIVNGREICWEVKGPKSWDDSIVKLKFAPQAFPEVQWWLVWKDSGEWRFQEILPLKEG